MERQVFRGYLIGYEVVPPVFLSFLFNPSDLRDRKPVTAKSRTGMSGGPRTVSLGERTVSFTLSLHERGVREEGGLDVPVLGISTELARLRAFLYPREDQLAVLDRLLPGGAEGSTLNRDNGALYREPPRCIFVFGARIHECIVSDLDIHETAYNQYLVPIRADVDITLTIIEDDDGRFSSVLAGLDRMLRIEGQIVGFAGDLLG